MSRRCAIGWDDLGRGEGGMKVERGGRVVGAWRVEVIGLWRIACEYFLILYSDCFGSLAAFEVWLIFCLCLVVL